MYNGQCHLNKHFKSTEKPNEDTKKAHAHAQAFSAVKK